MVFAVCTNARRCWEPGGCKQTVVNKELAGVSAFEIGVLSIVRTSTPEMLYSFHSLPNARKSFSSGSSEELNALSHPFVRSEALREGVSVQKNVKYGLESHREILTRCHFSKFW
jgi:hypothetical protein